MASPRFGFTGMKKVHTLLVALFASAMASFADVDLHDVTFTMDLVNGGHNNNNDNRDSDKNYQVDGNQYVGGEINAYGGFYIADGQGLKFNLKKDITVTHLYIGPSVKIVTRNDNVAMNEINWSDETHMFSINSGGWVDVDAYYDFGIKLGNMTAGDIYLNGNGGIASDMNAGFAGTIHAGLSIGGTPTLLTRVLIAGNFSGRDLTGYNFDFGGYKLDTTGNLAALTSGSGVEELSAFVGKYIVFADRDGIKVSYVVVPEPAAATLSLLALAGLAARRRRK